MIKFKVVRGNPSIMSDYEEYGIKFWYTGKTKGNPPKVTNVALIKIEKEVPFISANYEDACKSEILYCAKAVLVEEYAVLMNDRDLKNHQKGLKQVVHLQKPSNFVVAIFKGDNFCYKTGRLEAFKKLIKLIDDPDIRFMANQAYFDWEHEHERVKKYNTAVKMLTNAGYSVDEPNMEEPF
jgi:hypothetical protein